MVAQHWLRTALAGVLALAAWPAQAGMEIIGEEGMTTLISEGQLKSMGQGPNDPTHIFDVNEGRVTLVYPAEEVYASGTPEEYCQALKGLQEDMEKRMTEEERRMVEEFKRGLREKTKRNPEVRVEPRGGGGQVAGFGTQHYAVYVDQQLTEEVWLSDEEALMREFGDYQKLMDMTSRISRCISSTMGIAGGSLEEQKAYQELMEKGVELKSVEHTDGVSQTEQVQDIVRRDIPASTFEPPEGFKETSIKEVMLAEQEAQNQGG
ncbi:DUF4412 domain-containing protein [Thiohalorhabdus sp. Cl-TMA]|uniref:DUF4412 domain-containing protein n=1 Tax=Thiohalorhabdus methylotrophus TaxID=3242694 RepID=A0ABV4TX78_9GAMM